MPSAGPGECSSLCARSGTLSSGNGLAGSYLAPLVFMVRSHDAEIRRQAVCALSNLSDDPLRPTVARLRNAHGRSVLCDLLEFTRPPLNLLQRKDAVVGLTNLLRNQEVHYELMQEKLLPELLRLSRSCVRSGAIIGKAKPVKGGIALGQTVNTGRELVKWDLPSMRLVCFGIACLSANEVVAPCLLGGAGFVADLLRISVDTDLDDISIRRNSAHALAALAFVQEARVEIQQLGGLSVATELLKARADADLRWQGAMLAANLCIEPLNRCGISRSPLLPQMLLSIHIAASAPTGGECEQLALALATLTSDAALLPTLCTPDMTGALLAVARSNSARVARQTALWAISNLAAYKPTEQSLLSDEMLRTLIACASAEHAPTRTARRDALRALGHLSYNPGVSPGFECDSSSQHEGYCPLLTTVVQCGLSSDNELQDMALMMLAWWSESMVNHSMLVTHGALHPLVLALKFPSELARRYGTRGLACLSVQRYFRVRMRHEGAAAPLLQLMQSSCPTIRRNACRAVCNLSHEVDGSLEMLRAGGMVPAIAIARTGGSKRASAHGANAAWCASYAQQVVANIYDAWDVEERNAASETASLEALMLGAEGSISLGELSRPLPESPSRQSVRSRVTFPERTLVQTVFSSWRLVCAASRQRSLELDHTNAAERIQQGVRHRQQRQERRRRDQQATVIQTRRRGQIVRSRNIQEAKAVA